MADLFSSWIVLLTTCVWGILFLVFGELDLEPDLFGWLGLSNLKAWTIAFNFAMLG